MSDSIGLVLSGGGARGAYQVGVLSAISEILKKNKIQKRFDIYTGVSAGAINAAWLAAHAQDFHVATRKLNYLWSRIHSEQVFYTDAMNLGKIGLKWVGELSFGGVTGSTPGKALLDTAPLSQLLSSHLDFSKIDQNIDAGHLKALAITAVDYQTSDAITFVQGKDHLPVWNKARRRSERTQIGTNHIMASSAIPMLFPPIQVDDRHFGDGCVRNTHPCGPSIYLGAKKLIIIGVRKLNETADDRRAIAASGPPSVARVVNLILNAVLLDSVELDVERLERVNEFLRRVPAEHRSNLNYKPIDYAWISPSADIGAIAGSKANNLPRVIRYLLKGLGSLQDASEIVSYLLFDPAFCSQLIEIGYEDGIKQTEDILKIFA